MMKINRRPNQSLCLLPVMLSVISMAGIFPGRAVHGQQPGTAKAVAEKTIPPPASHLGYQPGADFHLANWRTVQDYFTKLDAASPNATMEVIGKSTQGRPMLLVAISAADTIQSLTKVQADQKLLADPRLVTDRPTEDRLVQRAKPVVLITGTIHSSETAATFMLMELAYELAEGRTPWAREVLENLVVLIVPSVNPDGVDIVADWYAKSIGKPWEGGGLPRLYHPYAGHDTNRDFFALNLTETVNLSKVLYEKWFPTICWDVHQMGSDGARLFVPPFFDPTNPNVDPRITQSIMLIGAHMANDLAAAGKKGILHSAMYDNWWNGGNRTTPQRHNIVAILTEAASVRMASPIFLALNDLKGKSRGFASHEPAVNFPDPWQGGWWRLRDIVDYELIAGRSLLTLAARYRTTFQKNYLEMGRDQIRKGESQAPYGWLVPLDQADPGNTWRMLDTLRKTGIEVQHTTMPLTLYGRTYPVGTWYLPARQPYRAHLKDMMESQKYPNRLTADGQAETPYDVAGWTMPLKMGVQTIAIQEPIEISSSPINPSEKPMANVVGDLKTARYMLLKNRSNDDLTLIQALLNEGVRVTLHAGEGTLGGQKIKPGFVEVEVNDRAVAVLEELSNTISSTVYATRSGISSTGLKYDLKPQRIAIYQPWEPSMDEGWTRLVLERLRVDFTTVHRNDILAGKLKDRFDCLVLPSIAGKSLREGFNSGETAPEYVGGLADARNILMDFVTAGGTIVALDNSAPFLIQELGLPVEDAVGSLPSKEFYGPGSVLSAEVAGWHPLTAGMAEKFSVYFDRSAGLKSAAKTTNASGTKYESVMSYGKDAATLLQSGWLLGPEKLAGLSALGECKIGEGHVVLFGFPPQNRAQTAGTFRLLVNALWRGGFKQIAAPVETDRVD